MIRRFSTLIHMVSFGLSSFSLNRTFHRRRRLNRRKFLSASERWAILGNRLKKAAEKVVDYNEFR